MEKLFQIIRNFLGTNWFKSRRFKTSLVGAARAYFSTTFFVFIVSAICYVFIPYVGYRAFGSVFLLSILALSAIASRGPLFLAAVLFAFVWNFLYIPPQFTFAIHAWEDIMMVISFLVAALVTGLFAEEAHKARLYQASENLHQTLLNSISHELRTPITAIMGSASALKNPITLANNEAREALTDELIQSALRLDRVVENLLDLSRLQKGTLQLKKEWFDLSDLFYDVRSNLAEESQRERLKLEQKSSVLIEGDFHLLSHALNQIVFNALKYSPDSSLVEVEILARGDGHARLTVKDHGPGIPRGDEAKIFEKFFRLPGTRAGGLGLGLTIAQSVLELHGGKISASNRTDLGGAIFEITIPTSPAPMVLQQELER